LKEHVGHVAKKLGPDNQETVKDREGLKAEITQLTRGSEVISQKAAVAQPRGFDPSLSAADT